MPTKKGKDELFLMYQGKPLTRSENTLYYGDPSEKYILMLQITDTEPLKDLSLPTRVTMSLISTDPDLKLKDKIIKKTEKNGIYAALDVGLIWLDRALKK